MMTLAFVMTPFICRAIVHIIQMNAILGNDGSHYERAEMDREKASKWLRLFLLSRPAKRISNIHHIYSGNNQNNRD